MVVPGLLCAVCCPHTTQQAPLEGATAYGSVVELSRDELARLDMYEGSYTKQDIIVVVGKGAIRQRKAATAYIADYPDTASDVRMSGWWGVPLPDSTATPYTSTLLLSFNKNRTRHSHSIMKLIQHVGSVLFSDFGSLLVSLPLHPPPYLISAHMLIAPPSFAFTPQDFVPPSEQYRTAIDVHLRENWGAGKLLGLNAQL